MGTRRFCDGCGVNADELTVESGRDYCGACATTVSAYREAVTKLHERIASEWGEKLAEIHAEYTSLIGGGLPF